MTPDNSILFIGSGNVASHYAKAFRAAGCTIRQVWSRDIGHAHLLADEVGAEAIDSLQSIDKQVDICVVAVSDDALPLIAEQVRMPQTLVVHTSGATGKEAIASISPKHGVLWSPQTFIRGVDMDYTALPFCIEGSDRDSEERIARLAGRVSSHLYHLDGVQRQWAHLGAVFSNNFVNAINAQMQQMMTQQGIPYDLLRPIVATTAEKAQHHNDLQSQQTGPAIRHDRRTMDRHRALLATKPQLKDLYDLMSNIIQYRQP